MTPFHSINQFPHRSIFGYFPEHNSWYQVGTSTDYQDKEHLSIGYRVPILVSIFHRLPKLPKLLVSLPGSSASSSSSPIKNKTRDPATVDAVDEEKAIPNPAQKPFDPNAPVTPDVSDGEEPNIPAVTASCNIPATVQARPKEIEDEGPATHVDWTSFDLGASLRNLRSSNEN